MKVTRHGITHPDWKIPETVDCSHCNARIEEITEEDAGMFDGATNRILRCPECERAIDLQ